MTKIVLFLLFFSSQIYANCHCVAQESSVQFLDLNVKTEDECKLAIAEEVFSRFKSDLICENANEVLSVQWNCSSDGINAQSNKLKVMKCTELLGREVAVEILNASLSSQMIINPEKFDPTSLVVFEGCEQDNLKSELHALETPNKIRENIRISLKSLREGEDILKSLLGTKELSSPSTSGLIFLLEGSDHIAFDEGDEVYLDGVKFSIKKGMDGIAYFLTAEYETRRYSRGDSGTLSLVPEDSLGTDLDPVNRIIEKHLVEENFGKILLEKEKQGDAMYWSVGGGLYQIDSDQSDFDIAKHSNSKGSEVHKDIAGQANPGSPKLYRDFKEEEDKSLEGMFVETKLGKRLTISENLKSRLFFQGESTIRGATTDEASFVEGDLGAFRRMRQGNGDSLIVGGGHRTRFYNDGSKVDGQYVEIGYGTKTYTAKIQYRKSKQSFDGERNFVSSRSSAFGDFPPLSDDTLEISLEYKW